MLSEIGSNAADRQRCLADHRDDAGETDCLGLISADVNLEWLDHVSRRVLLVGADVGGGVDRPTRHPGVVKNPQRLVSGVVDRPLADGGVEFLASLPSLRVALQPRIGWPDLAGR